MLEKAQEFASNLEYTKGQERLCTIITDKRGRVLSVGYNSYTDSCKMQRFYARVVGLDFCVFSHSEIDALNRLKDTDKPFRAYVARVNRKGLPLMAKPCKICSTALENFGVRVINYTEE